MLNAASRFLAGSALCALLLAGASPALAEMVLRRGNSGEPTSLDPHHVSMDIEISIMDDLFEGLTTCNAAAEIVPGVASRWTVSDDKLVYTFTLRPEAQWSDGTPVTAQDFVYSLRRVEDPKTAADYATLLYQIKNAEKVNTGALPLEALGVKAIDDRTLEISLERPVPFLLAILANPAAYPVKQANIEAEGSDFTKPGKLISNGAFTLTDHIANDHLTLTKNAHYWDAAHTRLDSLIFLPLDDEAAATNRFEAGELDINNDFPLTDLKLLRSKLGDQVHLSPMLAISYLVFDMRTPPFNDVRVRRALSMAIDRDFISREIYSNAQLPGYSFVTPGLPTYGTPSSADFATMSQLDREDAAVKLMSEAGYGKTGKPLEVEIRSVTNATAEKSSTAIADMWKTLFGAKVTITNSDGATHFAYLSDGGPFQVSRAAWGADYPDAETFLALGISTNTAFNYGHWVNTDFDALMKTSYGEQDPAARNAILHKAEAIMMAEQPVAPLFYAVNRALISTKVKGWIDNAPDRHPSRFLSVEK